LGRPVHAVALPELEPSAPDWSRDDVEPTTQMIEVSVQQDAGVKARRTPFIPKLP